MKLHDNQCFGSLLRPRRLAEATETQAPDLARLAGRIVPVEIKAGAAGAMKSLHQYMFDKGLRLAVRVDANPPSLQRVAVTTTQGDPVSYTLVSVPLYLLWRLPEVLATLGK